MFQGQAPTSPTRTNIEEANKHLQMLYKRIDELETAVKAQQGQLQQKDRDLQTSVTNVTVSKDAEIAELKNSVETLRIQNDKLKNELIQRNGVIEKLQPRSAVADKLVQHRDALYEAVVLLDSLTSLGADSIQDSDSGVHSARTVKSAAVPNDGLPENGIDADESDQSLEERFAKSSRLTHVARKNRPRHLSMSDEDLEDRDTVLRNMRRNKEFFL